MKDAQRHFTFAQVRLSQCSDSRNGELRTARKTVGLFHGIAEEGERRTEGQVGGLALHGKRQLNPVTSPSSSRRGSYWALGQHGGREWGVLRTGSSSRSLGVLVTVLCYYRTRCNVPKLVR
ncbi:hypothetical protein ROHU_032969 [Labeo rohita]|uniref:Uncharacterized protein n=1 Tax=Labeo rohita TaxID=84645 RepID=A0A498LLE6_LABRO|nr:hypothetical protein ROHU_032969 [Labeo rohita]